MIWLSSHTPVASSEESGEVCLRPLPERQCELRLTPLVISLLAAKRRIFFIPGISTKLTTMFLALQAAVKTIDQL